MNRLILLAVLPFVGGCSADGEVASDESAAYATQLDAPSPDYAAMDFAVPEFDPGTFERKGTGPLPPDAQSQGRLWLDRLEEAGMVDGFALAGDEADAAIIMIDLRITEERFNEWAASFDQPFPDYIHLYFVPRLYAPAVTQKAAPGIRLWPAAERRTGMQNMAALYGRVVLSDGCFYFRELNEEGEPERFDRLAWFLAETGLDVDEEGYFVLIDRRLGHLQARVGEELSWAGPNGVVITDEQKVALFEACGKHEIVSVGNPQALEKTYVELPHLRPSEPTAPGGLPPPPPRSAPPPSPSAPRG